MSPSDRLQAPHEDPLAELSRFVSYVLRHRPQQAGVRLDRAGWVDVEALLEGASRAGRGLTREQLETIVRNDGKGRYAFSADGRRIRANQGHSVSVELGLPDRVPPAVLYHGTVERFVPAIRTQGLKPMRRHAVHLSPTAQIALDVGERRGTAVVLVVDAAAMWRAGERFQCSTNGVWLTAQVLPAYIRFPPAAPSGMVGGSKRGR